MQLKLRDGETLDFPENKKAAAKYLADMFFNSGKTEDHDIEWNSMYNVLSPRQRMTDAVGTPDISPLLSSSLEIILREPMEPMMIITGLFQRVAAKGLETKVLAGAIGAVQAADVAENGTYPEVMINIGGGMQTAYIGKSGLQCSFTDEALRYTTWDIMAMNFRQMGKALVRHKESKAVSFLRTLGVELFNNASPTTSLFGVCTGRGLDMQPNGSMTMDDLFKGMAHMTEEGFPPNVLLLNPQFFYLFIQDAVLRNLMMAGAGGTYFQQWSGNPGPRDQWSNGSMGAQGPSLGNRIVPGGAANGETATGIAGREHGMTSAPPIPAPYFPWTLQVRVSPFVPFDKDSELGDILLLASDSVGFYLVDEEPQTVEWRDESVDVVKVKIRERYGFAVASEGQGVGIFKNVRLVRNYWDGTVTATTTAVDSEISPTAEIEGI